MSEQKQVTPGPWRVEDNFRDYEGILTIFGADDFPIACVGNMEDTEAVDHANADLIAAAPELLTLCESWLEHIGKLPFSPVLKQRTRETIAKAKGELS